MLDQANSAHASICLPRLFPPDEYELEPQLPPQLENPEIEDDPVEPDEDFGSDDNHEPYDPPEHCDHHVQKVVITADPLENANECTIVVIFGERCQDQIFYALSYLGELMSFGVTKSGDSTVEFITPENPSFECDSYTTITSSKRYLVEAYGELLLAERHFLWLDFDEEEGEWVEIESLGDVALFLGDNSSIPVLASNFTGCQPNCTYFTHDEDDMFGMYEVESQSFKLHYSMEPAALLKMASRPPIWVILTVNQFQGCDASILVDPPKWSKNNQPCEIHGCPNQTPRLLSHSDHELLANARLLLLPPPSTIGVKEMLQIFATKGMSMEESVAISSLSVPQDGQIRGMAPGLNTSFVLSDPSPTIVPTTFEFDNMYERKSWVAENDMVVMGPRTTQLVRRFGFWLRIKVPFERDNAMP
ncbi:heme peroxidase [Trema orientale]|uniref:Heme peroxidase n=1 Tax=Trema orientale TaxID=63057 RepID=A0A2P5BII8_TREOI|nr:heme peroxidase [Trema orientale]